MSERFRSREHVEAIQWMEPFGILLVTEDGRSADKSSPVNVAFSDWLIIGKFGEREGVIEVLGDAEFHRRYEPLPKAATYRDK